MEHRVSPRSVRRPRNSYWTRARQRLLALPIFYKVLVANSLIVALGALLGTAITSSRVRAYPNVSIVALMAAFVAAGVLISIAANALVLRFAFAPLRRIERTIQAVRSGNTAARVPEGTLTDQEIERLAETLNAMLDELEHARRQQVALSTQVLTAQEEERRRISRELHDDTAQSLTSLLLYANALEQGEDRREQRQALAEIRNAVSHSLEGIRRLARELRPFALDDLGLAAALESHVQEFARRTNIRASFTHTCANCRLPGPIELALFRVAQEALTNVAKHAEARETSIRLTCSEHLAALSIRDDGHGFDVSASSSNVGLYSMRERIALVRGALTIASSEQGTEVRAEVPLDGR
jgi:two-component system, NarL family, sensor histidine kinase UhpB